MISIRRVLVDSRSYLLNDDFNDDRAAGALNGVTMPAVPGPGNRTGVDSGSNLSISGGLLVCAGGSGTWGNPGLWESAVTRVAGKVLFGKWKQTSGANAEFGWDTNTSDQLGANAFRGAFVAYDNGVIGPAIFTAVAGTQYILCLVLRTSGAYYFIKGGTLTTWTLVWTATTNNTATLYPGIANDTAVFTADYIRVLTRLWLPPVLAHDTMTRADGAIGSTETAGPDGQGAPVLAWTGATWTIATNKAINTPTLGLELNAGNLVIGTWYSITATEANYFYTGCAIGDTFRATAATALDANNKVKAITLASLFATLPDVGTPNVIIDATLAAYTSPTQMGIVARLDSASSPANFIIANQNGVNVKIDECVAGVYTNLASVASAFAASDVLRLDLNGANYRLYKITSAGVATLLSASTTNILTGNLHGMMDTLGGTGNTFSKFTMMQKAGYSIPE